VRVPGRGRSGLVCTKSLRGRTDVVREVERVTVVIMLVVIVVLFYAKKMLKMGQYDDVDA
jgi:hypothetical protein